MLSWVGMFLFLTHTARRKKKLSHFLELLKQGYYGYDPFVFRGILTGLLYSILDGYITGCIIEFFVIRKKVKNKQAE